MEFDTSMTDKLLTTTRAVRKRLDLDRPVPRSIVDDCLELAVQAPSGGNSQGWRWIVVDDAEKRSALADVCRKCERGGFKVSRDRATAAGDMQTARVYSSASYLMDHLHEVPVHVIPCLKGRPPEDVHPTRVVGQMGSIFPAIWSFQLALRSRGLGSVLTTVHLFREAEVAEILNIPDDVMQVALIPVAYTLGTDFKRAPRVPAARLTHWNGW